MSQQHRTSADCPPPGAEGAPLGVSVIVPMFNESECAPLIVDSLDRLAEKYARQFDFQFVLVDDGSVDDTVARLQAAIGGRDRYALVEHGANRGIAAAIQTGLHAARHEIAASMDCDGSYDAELLAEMVVRLQPGVDLVTASPYHRAGAVENVPPWRLQLSRLASRMYGLVCRERLSCYTSCFRVYRRSVFAPMRLENHGFVGVAELVWKILDQGGRVVEQPAKLRSRVAGQSKMRVVRASLGHLRLMGDIVRQRAVARVRRGGRPRPRRSPALEPSPVASEA